MKQLIGAATIAYALTVGSTTPMAQDCPQSAAPARFDDVVRADFFAGLAGDEAAMTRAMRVIEDALAAEPGKPEPLVWHGAGLLARAAAEFERGDTRSGSATWQRGLREMNDAVRRAPDDVAVLIPRGATLLEVSRSASDPQEAPRLLALGVSDYEKVLALQAPYFKYLPEHARGELLFGLAEGLYRLGRPEDARRYLERLLAEAKDSSYRDLAAAWLANPDDARGREHGCVTCHAKTTARETRWTDVTTRLEAAAVKGSARDLQEIRRDLLARLSGQAAEHEPLAQYAVAYTAWRLAFVPMVPETDRDRMLDDAVERLQRFEGNTQEHAEALALLGGVYGEQIGRSPIQGMLKGPRAGRALDRAASMAPRNPRVAVLQAINAFNTPAVFGGGVDKAEQLLTTALELFAAEPPDKAWPNWGRFDAHAWLGQVRLRRGDAAGAQSEYDKALAIAPDSQWVRNVLLPAVSRSR